MACPQIGFVLSCEHPLVISLGKRALACDLLQENRRALCVHTDRGGQAVIHNPGQCVIYPILSLHYWGLTVRNYVSLLEQVTIHVLGERNITATKLGHEPGVWVDQKKIAAMGVRIRRGITSHGVAINISNDLEPFSWIRTCGQVSHVTRVRDHVGQHEAHEALAVKDFARHWYECLCRFLRPTVNEADTL